MPPFPVYGIMPKRNSMCQRKRGRFRFAMFFRGFGGTVSSAVVGTMCAASGPGAPGAMGTAIAVSALGAAASILLPRKVDRKR